MMHVEPVPLPQRLSLRSLRGAAAGCQACDLYKCGTQTVFGEGLVSARAVLVGETPGDQEDRQGRPFVGPAGRLLDKALGEAGIDRKAVYLTNAVKHFKWTPRGKRRLHQKPDAREQAACRPWLLAELKVIEPELIVCLGAVAAQSLLGKSFRVTRQRGEVLEHELGRIMATVHPSSVLRAPDEEARKRETQLFVRDLKVAARFLR